MLCFALQARAEKVEQLKPQGYVNDFAGVLDAGAREQLTAVCAEVDQKARAQIAVVTIKTLEGLTQQEFGNSLFKQWGVGYKPGDRGVLILLAVNDHKYWVEVGYGLEPILPDGKVGGFGREAVPLLRQSAYGMALQQLTWQVGNVIAQDHGVTLSGRPPVRSRPRQNSDLAPSILGLLFVGFILLFGFLGPLLRALFLGGPGRGGRRGGWGAGPWIWGSGGGWGGGGFGGGSGGGGFGGFGGGSSGGGGAGGSW
jgi:uncharacterized protein